MTQVQAENERLSRLEGAYEHLATKAVVERVRTDVERVRTEVERVRTEVERVRTDVESVRTDVESLRSELKGMKWIIGVGIAAAGAIGPIVTRILS